MNKRVVNHLTFTEVVTHCWSLFSGIESAVTSESCCPNLYLHISKAEILVNVASLSFCRVQPGLWSYDSSMVHYFNRPQAISIRFVFFFWHHYFIHDIAIVVSVIVNIMN